MKRLILVLLACSAWGAAVNISDTLTSAVGGAAWTGTITVTLNSPGSAQPLYNATTSLAGFSQTLCVGTTGSQCSTTSAAGVVAITLYANTSITPSGTSYAARYQPTRGGAWSETWVVGAATTTLLAIRSTTVPTPTVIVSPSQISSGGATSGQGLIYNGTSWAPANVSAVYTASAVIDVASVPDGTCVLDATAVTVTSAALGQRVTIGSSVAWPEGIKLEAKVTGPNSMKIEVCNHSGAAYNPASATYYFGAFAI